MAKPSFKKYNLGDITLNAQGYIEINTATQLEVTSGQNYIIFLFTWSSTSPVAAFNITDDGHYVLGAANQKIYGLKVEKMTW